MTAAVPGLERDMIAFMSSTVPRITETLDMLNVMTYDLINRRDSVIKHHTSIKASRTALEAYISRGAPANKLNLGFAFYVKWFRTEKKGCLPEERPIGCKTLLLEDPITGADLGRAGAFSWHDRVPEELEASFHRALQSAEHDLEEGGTGFWDAEEGLWWTFDTGSNSDIEYKALVLMEEFGLAGVFAYGLGEDAPDFKHLAHLEKGIKNLEERRSMATAAGKDEL